MSLLPNNIHIFEQFNDEDDITYNFDGYKWDADEWTKYNIEKECGDYYQKWNSSPDEEEEMGYQSHLTMKLLNHPFANSKTLDYFFNGVSKFLQEKEQKDRDNCRIQSQTWFREQQQFQVQNRHTECPICISEEFATCEQFIKCSECSGAICMNCFPCITGRKCPLCRTPQSMNRICARDMEEESLLLLPQTPTVREFVYQIRYQVKEGNTETNIFGEPCDYQFNIHAISDMEFDYEMAELIRLSIEYSHHLQQSMSLDAVNEIMPWLSYCIYKEK